LFAVCAAAIDNLLEQYNKSTLNHSVVDQNRQIVKKDSRNR